MKLPSGLRCPHCYAAALAPAEVSVRCAACDVEFPYCGEQPVLIRLDNPLFSPADYPAQPPPRPQPRCRLFPSASVNLSRDRVLDALSERLRGRGSLPATVLVVGAGMQREVLLERLGGERQVRVLCVDVDVLADVDFFADAHELPFVDGSVDVVIITAVLEHVLDPKRVAEEITRVLCLGGLLYSELPFMQQVHEGAYDFMRFTLSGHRKLFNRFREIEAGAVAGPGTVLLWSLEYFTTAFFCSPHNRSLVRAATRVLFFWVKFWDHWLTSRPAAIDGASCTYLFAERMYDTVGDAEIINRYGGARQILHT